MAEYFLNLTELKYDIISIRNKQYWARRSGIESKPLRKMKKKDNDHLVVYLGTGAVSILAVVQSQTDILPQIVGIAVYVLVAVSLTAACICFYRNLRKGVIERMLLAIRKTPLGARFLEDYTFRMVHYHGCLLQLSWDHALPCSKYREKNIPYGRSKNDPQKRDFSDPNRWNSAPPAEPVSGRDRSADYSQRNGQNIPGNYGDIHCSVYFL